MTPVNKALAAVLAVQFLLVGITRWPSGGPAEPRDLVGFPVDDLAMIRITGRLGRGEAAEVPQPPIELHREGDGWVITTSDGYPASDKLLEPTLESFGMLKVRDPIATTKTSHANLEVADEAYTRKLELESKGGEKRTLYIGAGQGKSAHVRVGGEDEVYDVRGFNAWSLAENANRYFDRDFLQLTVDKLASVEVERPGQPTVSLSKGDDANWTVSGLPDGAEVDQAAVMTFLNKVVGVRMADPAGKEFKPEMGLGDDAGLVVRITTAEPAETTEFRVGAPIENKTGRVWLKSDRTPFVLEAMDSNFKAMRELDPAKLVDTSIDIDAALDAAAPPGMPGHGAPPGHGGPPGRGGPPGHGAPPGHR